ncbi:CsbD family protein [Pseudonocardia saturnea]
MSFIDKAKHKAEEVVGEVKEKVGELTGDDKLRAEGRKDQVSGNVKQAGDSVEDAASNLGDTLRGDKH